jgi:hypothetical protein
MSEFKFACPGCNQRISVTLEYVGHQISCPVCHAAITVPAPPGAAPVRSSIATPTPPGTPPPPAPPPASRLSVSALSSDAPHVPSAPPAAGPEHQGSAQFEAHMRRKPKKSYTSLITGVAAVLLIGVAALLNKEKIAAKWHSYRGPTAAEIAAANQPPPLPPELTVDEVWQKVAGTYKGLTSFSAAGKSVSVLDYSLVNSGLAANGPRTTSADLKLKMGRPDNFRLDIVQQSGPSNITSFGWSAGKGDLIQVNNRNFPLLSRFLVFGRLNKLGSELGSDFITELYFNQSEGSPVGGGESWTRNADETINGKPCYVLAGTLYMRDALVWVDRETFLVSQIQFALAGKAADDSLDNGKIKSALSASGLGLVTDADVVQFKAILTSQSKLKGTITETFTDIKPNLTIAMADFEPAAPVAAQPANNPPGRGIGGSGPGGVGGRMRRGGGG